MGFSMGMRIDGNLGIYHHPHSNNSGNFLDYGVLMADVIDFIRETANYVVMERPDVYDHALAVEEISTAIDSLREQDKHFGCYSFTSFFLIRTENMGMEEFILSRKSAGMVIATGMGLVKAFAYDDDVQLPHILDGLDDDDET